VDEDWPLLIRQIKSDFGRVGKEKGEVLRSLEKWAIFPNKFVEVSTVCAELHGEIVNGMKSLVPGGFPRFTSRDVEKERVKLHQKLASRIFKLYRNCLELSLITPVLAEAFINMAILILCKKEIRENQRQFETFIRSNIDAKIFDLPYKCQGFERKIDPDSETYKNFKRVMDRRNHAIHGNIDPEREQTEIVYFEGRRPLFKEPGDHIAKRFETQIRQYDPEKVIKNYEDTHEFLISIAERLAPDVRKGFWQVMEDPYPGYDLSRRITGALLPEVTAIAHVGDLKYDDELHVNWAPGTVVRDE
jgi:hypothetical protein